jgi:hypothetical protein
MSTDAAALEARIQQMEQSTKEHERVAKVAASATEYHADESAARYASRLAFAVTVAALLGVVATGVIAVVREAGSEKSPIGPYGVIVGALVVLAAVSSMRMTRFERLAKDLGRVRRQLRLVNAQTVDLPHDVAVTIRALAAARILAESDYSEPWMTPAWPDANTVLALLGRPVATDVDVTEKGVDSSPEGAS